MYCIFSFGTFAEDAIALYYSVATAIAHIYYVEDEYMGYMQ